MALRIADETETENFGTARPLPSWVGFIVEDPNSAIDNSGAPMAEAEGISDGMSSRVLDLWIDLVRQAGNVTSKSPAPAANGLTRLQLCALDCLVAEGLTMRALARSLGVSSTAATSIADRLTSVGAAVRYRDRLDRRLVQVVITGAGARMASDHRHGQVTQLERLLDHMEPRRLASLTLAMKDLARAVSSPPDAPPTIGRVLTSEAQRWTLTSHDWRRIGPAAAGSSTPKEREASSPPRGWAGRRGI